MVLKPRMKLGETSLVECGSASRNTSSTVSWNCTGAYLACGSTDRITRLWTLESKNNNSGAAGNAASTTTTTATTTTTTAQEVLALSGHVGSVELVRFHPHEPSLLCTAAADASIRFWDVRWAKPNRGAMAKIDIQHGKVAASVEWCPLHDRSHYIVVTEGESHVHVYDTRKLPMNNNNNNHHTAATTTATTTTAATPMTSVQSYNLQPNFAESCRFSPAGNHLVVAATVRGSGQGEIHILPFSPTSSSIATTAATATQQHHVNDDTSRFTYPAHTGSIYAHTFAPNGRRFATGGSDAMIGIWDVATMICSHSITRRAKFIRSLTFSYDSKLLASSSEDDGIDVADANNGDWVGTIYFGGGGASRGGGLGGRGVSGGGGGSGGGADEIVFHPKAPLLACARGNFNLGGAPVVVAKIAILE